MFPLDVIIRSFCSWHNRVVEETFMPERWNHRQSDFETKRMLRHIEEMLAHQHELLHQINERIIPMSVELDRLTAEVAETSTAVDSIITLVDGLAQQIRDAAADPAKLMALADELDAKQAAIAAAVAANTPAPPPEEPAP